MPKQKGCRKYTRTLTCLLRCLLALFYLWIMIQAAAMVPVVKKEAKWFFWMRNLKFFVTFTSMLTFDMQTQSYLVVLILFVLWQIFHSSRCSICNPTDNIQGEKVPVTKRMLIFFGPYMMLFIVCWLASMVCLSKDLIRMTRSAADIQSHNIIKLLMTLVFKLLILANAIVRCIRTAIILQLFVDEPGDELRNPHNLGEHINLFFLN